MPRQEQWLVDFGSRLKAEREKQGLTQQALAGKALTKQDYIAQIERGIRNPTLRVLMNILSALDISADHLIYGRADEDSDEAERIINEFNGFLKRRSLKDVSAYYEIARLLSKFIDSDEN